MELVELLDKRWIKPRLDACDKASAIKELVDLLAENGAIVEPQLALQAVMEREAVRTTGIGMGLALPHGKYPHGRKPVIAIGLKPGGLDFGSVDGKPVDVIVLMISPSDQVARHIQALSRVSRYLSFDSFRKQLRSAGSAEEIYQAIVQREAESAAVE